MLLFLTTAKRSIQKHKKSDSCTCVKHCSIQLLKYSFTCSPVQLMQWFNSQQLWSLNSEPNQIRWMPLSNTLLFSSANSSCRTTQFGSETKVRSAIANHNSFSTYTVLFFFACNGTSILAKLASRPRFHEIRSSAKKKKFGFFWMFSTGNHLIFLNWTHFNRIPMLVSIITLK